MTFKLHFNHVLSKTASKISYLYGIKRYINMNMMKVMINSYINSIADYCLDIWAIQTNEMLQMIQSKVDGFLVNFFLPVLSKKLKPRGGKLQSSYKKFKANIDINEIRAKCNFFTIQERKDIFIAKFMFTSYSNSKFDNVIINNTREMPLFSQIKHKTVFFERCQLFRGIKFWNCLPRSLPLSKIGIKGFVNKVKEYLVKCRENEFIWY